MMPDKLIWCPNVILLDARDTSVYSSDQLIDLMQQLPSDIPFLFLTIGDFKDMYIDSQIIIQQHGYSIYKETINKRETFTSKLLDIGIQHIYYVHTEPELIKLAFIHFMDIIGSDYPVLCLAPHLNGKLNPALIVEAVSEDNQSEGTENSTKQKPFINLKNLDISFTNKRLEIKPK